MANVCTWFEAPSQLENSGSPRSEYLLRSYMAYVRGPCAQGVPGASGQTFRDSLIALRMNRGLEIVDLKIPTFFLDYKDTLDMPEVCKSV